MVNQKKLEKKLPNLLINGETTDPKEWNEYQKKRQRLMTFKKTHPKQYQGFANRTIRLLEEIDEALYQDLITVDKNLTDGVREAFGKEKRK